MSKSEQEVEVKFLVRDLPRLSSRLNTLGATLVAERVLETNLRFDTHDFSMRNAGQALRLRQDTQSTLTFKGPPRGEGGANSRQEIEFQVSNFGAARRFLEALGYQVTVIYEKYRTTFSLDEVMITLDEMPHGHFVEIEYAGESDPSSAIHAAADVLGLDWETRSNLSYLGLFDALKASRRIAAYNLTFGEMNGIVVTPEDLHLSYADTGT